MLTIILIHGIIFAAFVVALLVWWHFAKQERPWVPPIVVREELPRLDIPFGDRVCIHGVKEGSETSPHPACEECECRPYADEPDVRALYTALSVWEPYYASDKMDAVRRNFAIEIVWRRRIQESRDRMSAGIRAALAATSANQMRRVLETAVRSKT